MRSMWLAVMAGAGLGLVLATSPASSITVTVPAAVRHAGDALDLTETVHCRRYNHRHKKGHDWGRGCRAAAVTTGPRRYRRSGTVVRDGGMGVIAPPAATAPLVGGGTVRPNLSNPQDRLGRSNPQDLTRPGAINPQDRR